jgi:hypothetical protein
MDDFTKHLARLGYCRSRAAAECWRISQAGVPAAAACRDPAPSRDLLLWFNRLRNRRGRSPYRISPATLVAAVGRRGL